MFHIIVYIFYIITAIKFGYILSYKIELLMALFPRNEFQNELFWICFFTLVINTFFFFIWPLLFFA